LRAGLATSAAEAAQSEREIMNHDLVVSIVAYSRAEEIGSTLDDALELASKLAHSGPIALLIPQ